MCKAILTFFAICFCANSMAQSPVNKNANCDFLKNLHFKNGVDTLIIKGVYDDLTELMQGGLLMKTLIKEKKIRKDNFESTVSFHPVDCSLVLRPPSNAGGRVLNTAKLGSVLYFTCVFFERREWERNGVPFFVVIKAERAN